MFEFIEHVVYINLEVRTDRKEHIEKQLAPFGSRVERFDAIYDPIGAIGCTQSHIGVLEKAKAMDWKNVLIVEDDFEWRNLDEGGKRLEQLASQAYDVILLAGAKVMSVVNTGKLLSAQTTTCYLVASHYYDALLENYKEGLSKFTETKESKLYAVDQYWKLLMRRDNWYIVKPGLGYQRPDYSDIEKKRVNYLRLFS